MSYFNTTVYDASNTSYNCEFPIYIDGTSSTIPINGAKYYGNIFGNVMSSFIVDGGDSILGGNVIITQNISLGGGINIIPTITTTSGNITSTVQGIPTFISGNTLAYVSGTTSNIQGQINSVQANTVNQSSGNSTVLLGSLTTNGNITMNMNSLYLKGTDTNNSLAYTSSNNIDGVKLNGYSGGILGTNASPNALTWTNTGVIVGATTASTTTTTGALIVSGGVGVNGNVNVSGNINSTNVNGISSTKMSYLTNVTSDIQNQISSMAMTNQTIEWNGSTTFTGSVYTPLLFVIGNSTSNSLQCDSQYKKIVLTGKTGGYIRNGTSPALDWDTSGCTIYGNVGFTGNLIVGNCGSIVAGDSNSLYVTGNLCGRLCTSTKVILQWDNSGVTFNGCFNGIYAQQLAYVSNFTSDGQAQLNNLRTNSLLRQSTGIENYTVGTYNLPVLLTGNYNVGIGSNNMTNNMTGDRNTTIGFCAGTGIKGSDNTCIGAFSGITVANYYNQSTCLGYQSRITASNQVVLGTFQETVIIPGKCSLAGDLKVSGSSVVAGNLNVSGNSILTGDLYISGNITSSNSYIQTVKDIYLNNNNIYLRGVGNTSHSLGYSSAFDGVAVTGYGGGVLKSGSTDILSWNALGAIITGVLNVNGKLAMNDTPFYLRSSGDTTNSLTYDTTLSGVRLKGSTSGALSVGATDTLKWNSSNVSVSGSLSSTGTLTVPSATISSNITCNGTGIFGNISTPSGSLKIQGNVSLLPYNANTILSAHTLNCNAVTCLGQIVAGGAGLVTSKLQCSNNGSGILGMQTGTFQATTNGTQTVTFANPFLGTNSPLVFLQVVYGGEAYNTNAPFIVSTSVSNFTYNFSFCGSTTFNHAEFYVTITYFAIQT